MAKRLSHIIGNKLHLADRPVDLPAPAVLRISFLRPRSRMCAVRAHADAHGPAPNSYHRNDVACAPHIHAKADPWRIQSLLRSLQDPHLWHTASGAIAVDDKEDRFA